MFTLCNPNHHPPPEFLHPFSCVSWLSIVVTINLRISIYQGEWFILTYGFRVLVHGPLASLLWACGDAEHCGGECVVEQSWLPPGGQEARRTKRKGWVPNIPFKGSLQWPIFLPLSPTSCFSFLCSFFWVVLRFELRALHLQGMQSTAWARPSSPFCFRYFSDQGLIFAWAGLRLWCSELLPPMSWDDRLIPPGPAYFVEMGFLTNFLSRLTSNFDPPDFFLLSSWDYSCEPLWLGPTS
jgi:hypothetical protein